MKNLFDQIPGYREAIEQEQLERYVAFLSLPEIVCGIELPPLTLNHLLRLYSTGSQFMGDADKASLLDVRIFLLTITEARGWRRQLLLWRCRNLNLVSAVEEIVGYIQSAMADAPGSPPHGFRPSFYSFAAGLLDLFGREYGWPEQETLNIPLKRLFQYVNAITDRNNPQATLFNPSDKVRSAWLRSRKQNNLRN